MKKFIYIGISKNCMYTQVPIILKGIEAGKRKKIHELSFGKKALMSGTSETGAQRRIWGPASRRSLGNRGVSGRQGGCLLPGGGATQIPRPLLPGPDMSQPEAAQKPTDIRNPVVVSDRVVSWSELACAFLHRHSKRH